MTTRSMPIVDWLKIEASAPAKIIISGEYSVVYDKQAIATAIDLRTRVTIRPNKDGTVRLNLKNLNSIREWPISVFNTCRLVSKYNECIDYHEEMPRKLFFLLHQSFHKQQDQAGPSVTTTSSSPPPSSSTPPPQSSSSQTPQPTNQTGDSNGTKLVDKRADDAVIAFLLLYIGLGDSYSSSARPAIDVQVESEVPVGSGLGSSSAYSASLCGALMKVFRVAAEKHVISSWAFNIDKYFHGKPSGVDNNVITHGGYINFKSGKVVTSTVIHKAPIKVMLIDTGVSRSTKKLSERVIKQRQEDPNRVTDIFDQINEFTTLIWRNINEPTFSPRDISVFLDGNQQLLDDLQVGHPVLTDICSRARTHQLTAKQTGAGGGGVAFVLYDDSENCHNMFQLRTELKAAGYSIYDCQIGCEGLIVKLTQDPSYNFGFGGSSSSGGGGADQS